MKTACPKCRQRYNVDESTAGQEAECSNCGSSFVINPLGAAAADTAHSADADSDTPPDDGGRAPCPVCAESIMPNARKCRFCGHWLSPDAETVSAPHRAPTSWSGATSVVAFVLSLLAMPTAAALFLAVFGMSRLMQSLIVGSILAFVAVALAVAGVAGARGNKSVTRTLAVFAIGLGALAGMSMLTYVVLIHYVLQKTDAMGDSPVAQVMKQVIGPEEPAKVRLKCGACGEEFECTLIEIARRQSAQAMKLLGGGDIDQMLDDVEKSSATGSECPKCKKPAAMPMLKCADCGKYFSQPDDWTPGTTISCPHCGKTQSPNPLDMLDLGLPGLEGLNE